MSRNRRHPIAVLAMVVAVVAVSGACSDDGDGGDDASATSALEAPAFGGSFACTDEVGDQIDGATEGPAPTPNPGTDLVDAEVEVVADELIVRFTTDQPVNLDDQPRFVVAKGLPQDPATWFEARAFVKDGAWVVERRRMPSQLNAAGFAQERVDVLPVPVDVVDRTVSVALPISQLPAIDGTPTWQFGSAASGGAIFDDCNELVAE
jgi:hypothetical protein